MADQGRTREYAPISTGVTVDHRMTVGESLGVAEIEPAYYELSRAGVTFGVTHAIANAIAPSTTYPTTTAPWVLNNVDTNGKLLVPLFIGCHVASGTADTGATLFCGVTPSALATQLTADGTGVVHKSLRDAGKTPTAYADYAKTVVAPVYLPIAGMQNAAATTPGAGMIAEPKGLFIVKPTFALCLGVISGAGSTAKFCFSVGYAMIPNSASLP